MEVKSPFSISDEEVRALEHDDCFKAVQTYLAHEENRSFCSSHSSHAQGSRQTFILHRDILHSLLLPLLQIHSQAAVSAARALSRRPQTRNPLSPGSLRSAVDLELAFRGAARGAFSWLQCFIAQEQDWCSTKGCPACVVLKTLHSEPFIRVVVTSCRLHAHLHDLQHLQHQQGVRGCEIKTCHRGTSCTGCSATLPELRFWLPAMHEAVSEDEFWGLHFWEDIEARAVHLELGVEDLIRQCCNGAPSSPSMPASPSPTAATAAPSAYHFDQAPPPLETGDIVKRELRLQREEQEWMANIIEVCWSAMLHEAAYHTTKAGARGKLRLSLSMRPDAPRTSSLTT